MLDLSDLQVEKAGRLVCRVAKLHVERGGRVAVVGPNGSGKSTLLRVIAGLETQYQGQCTVAATVRQRVFAHQSPYLFRGSVSYNVAYGLAAHGVSKAGREQRVRDWLEAFGISHLAARSCLRLSGGERRRVSLARAFALRPELLLLDEPLGDLDQGGAELLSQAVGKLPDTTMVFASPVELPSMFDAHTIPLELPSAAATARA